MKNKFAAVSLAVGIAFSQTGCRSAIAREAARQVGSAAESAAAASEGSVPEVPVDSFAEWEMYDMLGLYFRVPPGLSYQTESSEGDGLLSGAGEHHTFTDYEGGCMIQFSYLQHTLLTDPKGASSSLFGRVEGSNFWTGPV